MKRRLLERRGCPPGPQLVAPPGRPWYSRTPQRRSMGNFRPASTAAGSTDVETDLILSVTTFAFRRRRRWRAAADPCRWAARPAARAAVDEHAPLIPVACVGPHRPPITTAQAQQNPTSTTMNRSCRGRQASRKLAAKREEVLREGGVTATRRAALDATLFHAYGAPGTWLRRLGVTNGSLASVRRTRWRSSLDILPALSIAARRASSKQIEEAKAAYMTLFNSDRALAPPSLLRTRLSKWHSRRAHADPPRPASNPKDHLGFLTGLTQRLELWPSRLRLSCHRRKPLGTNGAPGRRPVVDRTDTPTDSRAIRRAAARCPSPSPGGPCGIRRERAGRATQASARRGAARCAAHWSWPICPRLSRCPRVPPDKPDVGAKVALAGRLFHDLVSPSDRTHACADCPHHRSAAFTGWAGGRMRSARRDTPHKPPPVQILANVLYTDCPSPGPTLNVRRLE